MAAPKPCAGGLVVMETAPGADLDPLFKKRKNKRRLRVEVIAFFAAKATAVEPSNYGTALWRDALTQSLARKWQAMSFLPN